MCNLLKSKEVEAQRLPLMPPKQQDGKHHTGNFTGPCEVIKMITTAECKFKPFNVYTIENKCTNAPQLHSSTAGAMTSQKNRPVSIASSSRFYWD